MFFTEDGRQSEQAAVTMANQRVLAHQLKLLEKEREETQRKRSMADHAQASEYERQQEAFASEVSLLSQTIERQDKQLKQLAQQQQQKDEYLRVAKTTITDLQEEVDQLQRASEERRAVSTQLNSSDFQQLTST